MDIEKLKQFAEENNTTLLQIEQIIKQQDIEERNEKYREQYKMNQIYLGRYFKRKINPHYGMFPEMDRFYKVISYRTLDYREVECLVFDEHPTYWFEFSEYPNFHSKYYVGEFEFDSFIVEDIDVNALKDMKEIKEGEWLYQAHAYLNEMLDMKWVEDHYRYGGKLPSDMDWEIKN